MPNLRFSLPVIKSYRLPEVPKKIDDNQALKLVDRLDRSTDSGKRTYAIVQILNTYGVRGCQVRALKLSDIDWHIEQKHFPSVKGGKSCSFPLTAEVGNSLVKSMKYLLSTHSPASIPMSYAQTGLNCKPGVKNKLDKKTCFGYFG